MRWSSSRRRSAGSSGTATASALDHLEAEQDVAQQPALVAVREARAGDDLPHLADVVEQRARDEQIAVDLLAVVARPAGRSRSRTESCARAARPGTRGGSAWRRARGGTQRPISLSRSSIRCRRARSAAVTDRRDQGIQLPLHDVVGRGERGRNRSSSSGETRIGASSSMLSCASPLNTSSRPRTPTKEPGGTRAWIRSASSQTSALDRAAPVTQLQAQVRLVLAGPPEPGGTRRSSSRRRGRPPAAPGRPATVTDRS